ncbi:DUF5685 family protein [Actinokineospora bangkokensis]|uniref:Cysteine-rich transmembrane CYSTM domain-containing protein n=1 Tax=Actinokineospora bangkokensis TaxID=1193682 RepID=A0A1Q9LR90_9PSEU|nr:DUF5685 family protein [Actinokineospora bangkokensis]OLR94514.1 hypothetical protein BJP25_12280 [Actinokineospora bangkokensis]
MFGILRPCRHRLSPTLRTSWMAHLCGLCLALRDENGQLARTATNYDGLVISALVEAQSPAVGGRRLAGPCPLRGMRAATVARGDGAKLAAAVSLVLASAKVRDHVDDRDGAFGRRPVAGVARRVAARWAVQGERTGERVGFATAVLLDAVGRQGEVESALVTGSSVLLATEPAETATAAAFAHTALITGRRGNEAPLREAGRLFGRVAHLLDAVEDQDADRAAGAWNPLTATGTTRAEARRLCDDAVLGVRLALKEAEFDDDGLVHALLAHELGAAVRRTFGHVEATGPRGPQGPPPGWQAPQAPPPGWQPPRPEGPGGPRRPKDEGPGWGKQRGWAGGCAAATFLCCTCQYCCADPYHDPWTGEPKQGWCHNCDCSGCDCDCNCDCCCDGCCCDCG